MFDVSAFPLLQLTAGVSRQLILKIQSFCNSFNSKHKNPQRSCCCQQKWKISALNVKHLHKWPLRREVCLWCSFSASPLRSCLPYCCGPGFSDATTYLRTSNWGNISVKEILASTYSTSPFHTPSFSKSNCWNSWVFWFFSTVEKRTGPVANTGCAVRRVCSCATTVECRVINHQVKFKSEHFGRCWSF